MLRKQRLCSLLERAWPLGWDVRRTPAPTYAAIPASNQIVVYREDPNSGLLPVLVGSADQAGPGVESIVIHPSKKFLYAANSGESDVSLFNIATDGGLTEVTPRTIVGNSPNLLAMDTAGSFLYVSNFGSHHDFSFFHRRH